MASLDSEYAPLPSQQAEISYFDAAAAIYKEQKPFISYIPFKSYPGELSNTIQKSYPSRVYDIRSKVGTFNLERNGFQYVEHVLAAPPSEQIETFEHAYLQDLTGFLHDTFKPSYVMLYDAMIRKVGKEHYPWVSTGAHIDHTPENCQWRLCKARERHGRQNDGPPRRWQILTIWRPLSAPIVDWPLALCDTRSVKDAEKHSVDTIFPHYSAEVIHMSHSSEHRWCYLSDHKPEELLLIKCYDSDHEKTQGCPHISFKLNPEDDFSRAKRESIEVRAILAWD